MTTGTTLRESVRGVPASPVRTVVSGYHGYLDRGVPPALHRGLPSPYLTEEFGNIKAVPQSDEPRSGDD